MYARAKPIFRNCMGYNVKGLDCKMSIKVSEFLKNDSENLDGYTIYCRNCINKMFKKYLEKKSFAKSIYIMCGICDFPYVRRIIDNLKEEEKEDFTFSNYCVKLSEFNEREKKDGRLAYVGFSMSDDFVDSENIYAVDTDLTQEEKNKQGAERIAIWGVQDKEEDYIFLEDTFNRYTSEIEEFANEEQIDLYRDLCLARLTARKINDGRYDGDSNIDKIQLRITKLMSVLKVDEYKNNIPKSLAEKSLFERIKQCDEKTVKEAYENFDTKYKDINKIKEYSEKFVLRPLLNTLVGHKDFEVDLDDIEKYDELND